MPRYGAPCGGPSSHNTALHPDDPRKFKTPTLRNVVVTAPYMHDGSVATVADAIKAAQGLTHADWEHYCALLRQSALSIPQIYHFKYREDDERTHGACYPVTRNATSSFASPASPDAVTSMM